MRKVRIWILLFLMLNMLAFLTDSDAQTRDDSLAIVSAQWEAEEAERGLKSMCFSFASLYQGPQYVSIVEVGRKGKHRAGIAFSGLMKPLSRHALEYNAKAAINGSFYDMQTGRSVAFLKHDGEVVDSTKTDDSNSNITGAVAVRKGKLKLLSWSRAIERGYRKKHGSVLASGPLLLEGGRFANWSSCNESLVNMKHPRSAIAITKDGRILLIAVDGRAEGHAAGMTIPELAHFIRILGGKTALNLDGGGSTTLYLNHEVLNHPCDNHQFDHQGERNIPNIIYFN